METSPDLSIINGKATNWKELEYCLHELFLTTAETSPNKPAVTYNGETVTYQELLDQCKVLSVYLQTQGVGPNLPVFIFMEHSTDYVMSLISIHMAGGGYMTGHVSTPLPILKDMLAKTSPPIIITKSIYAEKIPEGYNYVCIDDQWDEIVTVSEEAKDIEFPKATIDDLAYIVFSSGTTGKSKGIRCPHRGAVNSYTWRHKNLPFVDEDRVAVNVFFVWECLRPLLKGNHLYIIPDDVIYDPPKLIQYLEDNSITRMLFTPSLLQATLDVPDTEDHPLADRLKTMTFVWLCGEVVTVELQKQFLNRLPHCRLGNLYSISECHDVSTAELSVVKDRDESEKYCPCGDVMDNVLVVVMDNDMNILPKGQVGELWVGGYNVAIGYLNDVLTEERFKPHEICESYNEKRLYKTGDIARILPDDTLEIRGRCNSMVKIRGYSIELGAVEAALSEHENVLSARVVVDGEELLKRRLVGYVVLEKPTTGTQIRLYLKDLLPHYMIPNLLIQLDALPIGTSWKLGKLPKPEDVAENILSQGDYKEPRNEMEQAIADYFRDILDIPDIIPIGIEDNFIDLGANSFHVAKLYSILDEKYSSDDRKFELRDIYEGGTIAEIYERLTCENQTGKLDLDKEAEHIFDQYFNEDTVIPNVSYSSDNINNIFITGVTGFLGAFILAGLMDTHNEAILYCHVRGNSTSACMARIISNLKVYSLWEESYQDRIVIVIGDLSSENLGIADEMWDTLTENIDVIYHNGALVDFNQPYVNLKKVNAKSICEIGKLALSKKLKGIVYVSTCGVFSQKDGSDTVSITDKLPTKDGEQRGTGYEISKYVAEKISVLMRKLGIPLNIVRPGNACGDSVFGRSNRNHDLVRMLKGFITLKIAPEMWEKSIDVTPVDFISRAIVSCIPESSSMDEQYCFNLISRYIVKMSFIIFLLSQYYNMKCMDYNEFLTQVKNSDNKHLVPLYPVLKNEEYINSADVIVEDSVWEKSELPHPIDIITLMIKNFIRNGVVPPSDSRPLFGKRYVITGASSGIGAAITKALSYEGAYICIGARREERLREMKAELVGEDSLDIVFQKTDVTNREEVEDLVKLAIDSFGGLDGIILNAGIMSCTLMEMCKVDIWDQMIDVNIKGVLYGIAATLPKFLSQGAGDILVMSSNGGRKAWDALGVYCGTKFAVEAIFQTLRTETCGKGIRAISIQPGDVDTELLQASQHDNVEKLTDIMAQKILEPKDVANAVVYALSQPRHVSIGEVLIEPSYN
eukprot:TRINITY_DN6254_c0_g1_i1.p1 TRINITY_DN6254_c0_g1~~TRINITY_DN6254_c0_g1_i1.p1  ORF type:complete len:1256 (-),score=328.75 TRINITY_DN6254_c0_g1_i1:22-3789(-)